MAALEHLVSWLPGGGRRLDGDGEDTTDGLDRIARAPDGRFVINSARNSVASSSDDGGFLAWRRRPLVAHPSLPSLRSDGTGQSNLAALYTPRIVASSPSHSHTPLYTFSDMSSVPVPGSEELRSIHERYSQELPVPRSKELRFVHERYSQELPALRTIHSARYFVPVQPRQVRSAPDLSSGLLVEASPESRSSSSGVWSKNTSSQQNQSSQSGSTTITQPRIFIPAHITPPPTLGDWLEFTPTAVAEVSPASVDIHYEFDAVFPTTPTPPITRPRYENMDTPQTTRYRSDVKEGISSWYPLAAKRPRYDNMDARVSAMLAEYRQFKIRQEERRRSEELESVC